MLQESRQLHGDRREGTQSPGEDRRDAKEQDEGRDAVLAPGDPEKPGNEAETETDGKRNAYGHGIEGKGPADSDLKENEPKTGGDENAGEEGFQSRGGDSLRENRPEVGPGYARGHHEEANGHVFRGQQPNLAEQHIETRDGQPDQEVRGDRPSDAAEEGEEDGSSVFASPDSSEAREDSDGSAKQDADHEPQAPLRQGACWHDQGRGGTSLALC